MWPYWEPAFPAATLPQMWNAMVEDRTLHRVFYERPDMTFPDLVRFFDPRANPGRFLLLFTSKEGDYAGFCWFDDVAPGVRVFAHICMRKAYWGQPTDEAARMTADYIFTAHKVPSIFAAIPVPNRIALAHVRRLGFETVARVDGLVSWRGEPCAGILVRLRRHVFYGD